MTPLELATDGLAAFRLTRLVTRDTITDGMRQELAGWSMTEPRMVPPRIVEAIDCDWCVGVWAAFAVRLLPRWLRRALATAALVGLIAERE